MVLLTWINNAWKPNIAIRSRFFKSKLQKAVYFLYIFYDAHCIFIYPVSFFLWLCTKIDMNTNVPKFAKNKIFVTVLLLTYLSSEPIAISYA